MYRLLLLTGIACFYLNTSRAQAVNVACWTGFEMYLPFEENGRWGLMFESYLKGNKGIADLQGSFYRAGASYYLKNGDRLGAGIAYQWNLPYDEAALPYNWPDIRLWEQYILRGVRKDGDRIWSHRFRLEQRWFGRKNDPTESGFDHYDFEQTFRYQCRYQLWFKPRWSVIGYDELHLRTLADKSEKLVDQNRLFAGMGYALNKAREWRLEVGYMHQSFWKSADTEHGKSRINHTIRITLTADVPMKKHP